jgi:hypothetical protein
MPRPRLHASAAARQAAYRQRSAQARQVELCARGLPPLPPLPTVAGRARWKATFVLVQELLAETLGEMADYFEERSERWQESDRGEEHQEQIASVETVLEALEVLTG